MLLKLKNSEFKRFLRKIKNIFWKDNNRSNFIILLRFSSEINHEEIRFHMLFSLYFILDNDYDYSKQLVLQDQQLLRNIINFEINPEFKEKQLFIRIIGSLLRGNESIVNVK